MKMPFFKKFKKFKKIVNEKVKTMVKSKKKTGKIEQIPTPLIETKATFKLPQVIVTTTDTTKCPRCDASMKNIKGNDFVCENNHGWSGWPPPK